MALGCYEQVIKHAFRIQEFLLPSSIWLEMGGSTASVTYGAPSLTTPGGGTYTSTALNNAVTILGTSTTTNLVRLMGDVGGVDTNLYYWFLPTSPAAGSDVTINANALPVTVNAGPVGINTEAPRDVVKHVLGTTQMPRPDHLFAALGKESAGAFVELALAGYAQIDVEGIWTAVTNSLPAEDRTYVYNNTQVQYGPSGATWNAGSDWDSVYIVDSGGAAWWRVLGATASTVPSGNTLTFETESLFGWIFE